MIKRLRRYSGILEGKEEYEETEKKSIALGDIVAQGESAISILDEYLKMLADANLENGHIAKIITAIEELNREIKQELS